MTNPIAINYFHLAPKQAELEIHKGREAAVAFFNPTTTTYYANWVGSTGGHEERAVNPYSSLLTNPSTHVWVEEVTDADATGLYVVKYE